MSIGAVLKVYDPYSVGHKAKPIEYIVTEKGCWECISHTKDTGGYPQLWRLGGLRKVHRYVYELLVKKIKYGLCLLHHCDNRCCINPDHMFEGTYRDNNQDMMNKRRHPSIKLSELDVQFIRSTEGVVPIKVLACLLDVHSRTIQRVLDGSTWSNNG